MSISAASNISAHPQFTVRKIPESETCSIVRITKEWCERVTEMQSDYTLQTLATRLKLSASGIIIDKIREGLEHGTVYHSDIWDTVFVCEDKDRVETIALFEESRNKLVYLATNPKNIAGIAPVRGAPKQIIVELARLSLKSNRDLRVTSTRLAEGFYKKLGFCKDEESSADHALVLTVAKIEQLIADKIPPFDLLHSD